MSIKSYDEYNAIKRRHKRECFLHKTRERLATFVGFRFAALFLYKQDDAINAHQRVNHSFR